MSSGNWKYFASSVPNLSSNALYGDSLCCLSLRANSTRDMVSGLLQLFLIRLSLTNALVCLMISPLFRSTPLDSCTSTKLTRCQTPNHAFNCVTVSDIRFDPGSEIISSNNPNVHMYWKMARATDIASSVLIGYSPACLAF